MFTKIPVKSSAWTEDKGADAVCWLPFAGILCGSFTFLVSLLPQLYKKAAVISPVILLLSLYAVCGFLHLDGFMDTADAMLSSRDREGKIRILKDSSVGAFSVISVVLLSAVLFYSMTFWAAAELHQRCLLIAVPAYSRAFSTLMMFTMPPLADSTIMAFFLRGKSKKHIALMAAQCIITAAAAFAAAGQAAVIAVFAVASALCLIISLSVRKSLGGINGDITGAMIVMSEAMMYLLMLVVF